MIVLLDMDSTVYDLLTPTLKYVETVYDKSLTPQDIDTWRWDTKYNVNLMPFWNQRNVFMELDTFPFAVDAIRKVHKWGVRQVFFSSAPFRYAAYEKMMAVERDFPFIGKKDVLITGGNKDLICGDIMVDDGPHNLDQFQAMGGLTVLADMHNAPYCKFEGASAILKDWRDYPKLIACLANMEVEV